MTLKTPDQIKAEFANRGESLSAWAAQQRLPTSLIYDLLSGRVKGNRGNAHRAAVLLGLKSGELPDSRQRAA